MEPIDMEPIDENFTAGAAAGAAEIRRPFPALATSGVPVRATADLVSFDRRELREILDLYGRKVAEGEWRDYALDFSTQMAVFSIFRRTSEFALYRIEKVPRLTRKQGAYSVVAATGLVLKRGHELGRVLAVLEKKLRLVADRGGG
jgi:hypothetical protein